MLETEIGVWTGRLSKFTASPSVHMYRQRALFNKI